MSTRRALLAGSWYPGSASGCRDEIRKYLEQAPPEVSRSPGWLGGIVPHAGWYFSGNIACNVIHRVSAGDPADAYVVFGMHLAPGSPATIMAEGDWETPLGPVSVDAEFTARLMQRFDFQVETAQRHTPDNTIEVQLPFLRHFAPEARLVPVGAPPGPEAIHMGTAVRDIAEQLGRNVRVIGSTDLTHYGPNYGFSPQGGGEEAVRWVREENDRVIVDRMLAMDPQGVVDEALARRNACCSGAAAAAIAAAKSLGAETAETLAYATSYDKNPGDSFVGYVGMLFGRETS